MTQKVLIRKVFKVGDSRVVSLPPTWCREVEYVAVRPRDGELVIQPLGVKA